MKTFLMVLAGSLFLVSGSAQKIDSAMISRVPPAAQEQVKQYLAKSKHARNWGFGMLGGGAALLGIWAIVDANSAVTDVNGPPYGSSEGVEGQEILGYASIAMMVGSIPFFVHSNKQREKARLLLYTEKIVSLSPNLVIPNSTSHGLRLVVQLGRF